MSKDKKSPVIFCRLNLGAIHPNLVSEALWLLADPKGYKEQIMSKGEAKAVEKTVRKLKTAQSSRNASSTGVEPKETKTTKRRTLPRGNNIFKRF